MSSNDRSSSPDPNTGNRPSYYDPAEHLQEIGLRVMMDRTEQSLPPLAQLLESGTPIFSISRENRDKQDEAHWADVLSQDTSISHYGWTVETGGGKTNKDGSKRRGSGIVVRGKVVEPKLAKKAFGYLDNAENGLQAIDEGYGVWEQTLSDRRVAAELPDLDITKNPTKSEVLAEILADDTIHDSAISLALRIKSPDLAQFVDTFITAGHLFEFDPQMPARAQQVAEQLIGYIAQNLERVRDFWISRTKDLPQRFHEIRMRESRAINPGDRRHADLIDRQLGYL